MSQPDPPHASVRLFIAFRLPAVVVDTVAEWQRHALGSARDVRLMPPDQFHVTAVFLGSHPLDRVDGIADTMSRRVATSRRPLFRVDRYRETSRAGMVSLREDALAGDDWAGRGAELVGRLMLAFEAEGLYRREHREWRPHVTVARFRNPPRLAPAAPDVPPFRPTDVVLFQSILGATGSTYVEQARVAFPPDT